jgi:hypothetical protein
LGTCIPRSYVVSGALAASAPAHAAPTYMPAPPKSGTRTPRHRLNGTDNQLPAAAAYYPVRTPSTSVATSTGLHEAADRAGRRPALRVRRPHPGTATTSPGSCGRTRRTGRTCTPTAERAPQAPGMRRSADYYAVAATGNAAGRARASCGATRRSPGEVEEVHCRARTLGPRRQHLEAVHAVTAIGSPRPWEAAVAEQPFSVDAFGGLNVMDDPEELGASQAVALSNVDFSQPGRVSTRDGWALLSTSATSTVMRALRITRRQTGPSTSSPGTVRRVPVQLVDRCGGTTQAIVIAGGNNELHALR